MNEQDVAFFRWVVITYGEINKTDFHLLAHIDNKLPCFNLNVLDFISNEKNEDKIDHRHEVEREQTQLVVDENPEYNLIMAALTELNKYPEYKFMLKQHKSTIDKLMGV